MADMPNFLSHLKKDWCWCVFLLLHQYGWSGLIVENINAMELEILNYLNFCTINADWVMYFTMLPEINN